MREATHAGSDRRHAPPTPRRGARRAAACAVLAFGALLVSASPPSAAQGGEQTVLDARDAFRRKDRARLAALRLQAAAERNALASWVDYWELNNRLGEAQPGEVAAFFERWAGSYVEDRLRNDWLLELGRRREFTLLAAEYPRFRMDDDREVRCYVLVAEAQAGKDVKAAALPAWFAQKDADDGCALLAATLADGKGLAAADVWKKIRLSAEANKPKAARLAAGLLGMPALGSAENDAWEQPSRYLLRKATASTRSEAELTALALARLATSDTDSAAALLDSRWERALPADLAAWCWAQVARQSALKLAAEASDQFARAERAARKQAAAVELSDEVLAWKARAALRADGGKPRWPQVLRAIEAMSPTEQRDAAWQYWKARALKATAAGDGPDAEAQRAQGRELLQAIAAQMSFYGQLAAEELGATQPLPARPVATTAAERDAAAARPGLQRALALIGLGLRGEGVREWNYTLRGLGDRELLAAAALACDREVYDRCINTSDRTVAEVDVEQRFPRPLWNDVSVRAREIGLDPAFVYGLIRQESRFVLDARSGVGASGLMQIMPATARWTARKIGLDYSPASINDRDTNLRLGNAYLKLVLDDAGGSQPMAAAAYNAGPGRPRKWREGPTLEPAVWAENIPFAETRDYVKKVISNAAYYAAILGGRQTSVRARLGRPIGPPDPNAPPPAELP